MIITLVIGLTLALVLGMLAQQLRLSPLVGYLVAGMLAAQPWWGHPVDSHIVEEFSHIGVALLLFGVGLHFHFKDLLAVRKVALPGSCICMVLWTGTGGLVYYLLGGPQADWLGGIMFGMCVCVSSTVVLTRVLSENRLLQTPSGHTALGWLVVEDIFTIIMLVLLPVLFGGDSQQSIGEALGWMALKLVAMVFCVAYLGRKVIARVLTYVSRHSSDELFTLAVLVFALGIAVLSAHVFNASMEFGAFLSGMVVGQSKFASRAASDALPMRHAFAVLFFVSVGMGFNLSGIAECWPLALGTVLFTLLFKPVSAYFIIRMLRRPGSLGVIVGTSLSQIGEFSFILAALAAGTYGLMPLSAANVITGVAIITITLNAALYRFVPGLIRRMEDRGIGVVKTAGETIPPPSAETQRVIVVGYGPCGEITSDILRRNNIEVVVIEMNVDTVIRLQQEGVSVIHGDARLRSLLQSAGVEGAEAIVVSVTAAPADEIAEAARSLNPNIGVIAATHFIRNAQQMRSKGARAVFSGEEELALSMGAYLLHSFGAPDEQVVRERNHMRRKLAGELPYLDE